MPFVKKNDIQFIYKENEQWALNNEYIIFEATIYILSWGIIYMPKKNKPNIAN